MQPSSSTRAIHRLAVITTAACLVLQLAGGWVHATGSSLACPDWPLCHGEAFPTMIGGILYEHGHRLLAVAVVTLISGLSWLVFRSRPVDPVLRSVAAWLVGTVFLQSTLGGLTVLLRLPPVVSIAHLALSQVLFVSLLFLALRTRRWGIRLALPSAHRNRLLVAAISVFLQEILGALVRHLGAGLACGFEFPACHGALLPVDASSALHFVHRVAAFVLTAIIVWACLPLVRAERGGKLVAFVACGVLVVQILLGIGSVVMGLAPVLVTLHLGGGALLLAWLSGAYLLSCATDRTEPSFSAETRRATSTAPPG